MKTTHFKAVSLAALGFWIVMMLFVRTSDGTDSRRASENEAVCKSGEQCYFECGHGRCHQTCEGGSDCKTSCAGGGCRQTCESGATCHLICGGAGCLQECVEGSTCRTKCEPFTACKVRCPGSDQTDGIGCPQSRGRR